MDLFINSQSLKQPAENITLYLDNLIDNTKGCYKIALMEVSFCVGYYNISEKIGNNAFQYFNGSTTKYMKIVDGLYNVDLYFSEIKRKISADKDKPENINFETIDQTGKIILSVSDGYAFHIIGSNQDLLGFSKPTEIKGRIESDRSVNFSKFKNLFINLEQINRERNYLNNHYSNVLKVIPVTANNFGESVVHRFEVPTYHGLINTHIHQLHLSITNEDNQLVNFNDQPITYHLHISC